MENIVDKLLNDFEHGRMNRRQLVQSLAVAALAATPAAAEGKGFQAVAVNHISYQVADYAKTRDFYSDLLGMKVSHDEGKGQCYMSFGSTFLLPRTPQQRAGREGKAGEPAAPPREMRKPPLVDHIAYTIDVWDKKQVEDELKRRGYKLHDRASGGFGLGPMEYRPDTDDSFHILDPDGFDLQISGRNMKA